MTARTSLGPLSLGRAGDFSLQDTPHLYCLFGRKGVSVDLVFECEGDDYRIDLCGTPNVQGGPQAVAHIIVPDDGIEYRLEVDLKGALSRFLPQSRSLRISNVRFEAVPGTTSTLGGHYSVKAFSLRSYSASNAAPGIVAVMPPYQEADGGELLRLPVNDPTFGGLLPGEARYIVDGKEFKYDGEIIRYDAVHRRLEFRLGRLGIGGGEHRVEIRRLGTTSGGQLREWAADFKVDLSKVNVCPEAVFDGAVFSYDFEDAPLGVFSADTEVPVEWNNFELPFAPGRWGAGFVSRYDGGDRGYGYLRVFNRTNGGPFALGLVKQQIDLLNCPLFVARLRSDRPLPLSLYIKFQSGYQSIRLPDFRGTGDWELVLLDLTPYLRPGVPAEFVGIVSGGWQGIPKGEYYDIDTVRFARVVSPARMPRVSAWDCSGPVAVWVGTSEATEQAQHEFAAPKDHSGIFNFWWKATDGRGNSTPAVLDPIWLDPVPPTVSALEKDGRNVTFVVRDNHAVVPSSVYVLLDNGLSYNLRNGLKSKLLGYSFELPDVEPHAMRVFATDYAGNNMEYVVDIEGEIQLEDETEDIPLQEE
ncbi:MAG: hypothetical protein Kow00107_09970 [Planctomycetota bacterium]